VDQITFKDFQKLQLKVGRVLEAESVPKSKKLLRLQVDLGEESPRQIVSGISPSYQPQDLVGTNVIVVTNLAPAKIMGVESNGMILSGEDSEQLSLLRLDRELPPGSEVR
jgi:methionyl-tRNA synthetase